MEFLWNGKMKHKYYNTYSDYLKKKYGERVHKIPISLRSTCPNRDGTLSNDGCIFCGDFGTGFENLSSDLAIKEQLHKNVSHIKKKYKAHKYIAYFQNYTNTYFPFEEFKGYIEEVIEPDVVGISISTRPDCLTDEQLNYLSSIQKEFSIDICIELGLQTSNYHTLAKLNRQHSLAVYIYAMQMINKYDLESCTHVILDLPWDNIDDVIETALIISAMNNNYVKCHSLYIEKNTKLAEMYKENKVKLLSMNDYIERVIVFLEHLDEKIVVQRIISRAPKENTEIVNWNTSWWKIKDYILDEMQRRNAYQGKKFNFGILCDDQ
jgi:hypothetical protein